MRWKATRQGILIELSFYVVWHKIGNLSMLFAVNLPWPELRKLNLTHQKQLFNTKISYHNTKQGSVTCCVLQSQDVKGSIRNALCLNRAMRKGNYVGSYYHNNSSLTASYSSLKLIFSLASRSSTSVAVHARLSPSSKLGRPTPHERNVLSRIWWRGNTNGL